MTHRFVIYDKSNGTIVRIGMCSDPDDLVHQITDPGTAMMRIENCDHITKKDHKVRLPAPEQCGCADSCGGDCPQIEPLS